jgi:hypothetical protein
MSQEHRSPPRRAAGWLAARSPLPLAVRAVLRYYATTGVVDTTALRLRGTVEDDVDAIIDEAYRAVEDALADEFDLGAPTFAYETKLTLPVELTLGYCYRRADGEADRDRARAVAELVTEALLDGDMRDAINDAEFEDFEVDFPTDAEEIRRVAEVAQATLENDLQETLDDLPSRVRETYDDAVAYSEAHQDRDPHFRELMEAAEAGEPAAADDIRAEYRDADLGDAPRAFDVADVELPYLKTQYARVGVLYDAMLELYRHAGLGIDEDFARAIVLAIVGAQIWLDDVDDYDDDLAEGQLTPVTAEYLLAEDDREAYENVVEITEQYLDIAQEHATEADSALTGIAIEYIYRSGEPGVLPGSH